jgi:hypothetical protein
MPSIPIVFLEPRDVSVRPGRLRVRPGVHLASDAPLLERWNARQQH